MTAISGRRRRVADDKSRDRRRLEHGYALKNPFPRKRRHALLKLGSNA